MWQSLKDQGSVWQNRKLDVEIRPMPATEQTHGRHEHRREGPVAKGLAAVKNTALVRLAIVCAEMGTVVCLDHTGITRSG